ncbi:MAG: hypothetical protein AAFX39_13255 [Pseudomonadota bacterium]
MTWVFRYDGTLQCGMGKEIPLDVMQRELEALSVSVEAAEKRPHPNMIPQACGLPTGMCNVFDVGTDDWPREEWPSARGRKSVPAVAAKAVEAQPAPARSAHGEAVMDAGDGVSEKT